MNLILSLFKILSCNNDLVSLIFHYVPSSHGEIKLGVLDFGLFSELAILVLFFTLTFKPFWYVHKYYVPKENDVINSTHDLRL